MNLRSQVRAMVVMVAMAAFQVVPTACPGADFEQDILSLLKDRCFACHDGRKQLSGLRLDIRSRAFQGGESGKAALVPGQPDSSELLRRVTSDDPDLVMPPLLMPQEDEPSAAARLDADQVQRLREWVIDGAKWPDEFANEMAGRDHWAFRTPQRPAIPSAAEPAWARTPVDEFIAARLRQEGQRPSPPTDKITLARRLFLDLIGLPPTPAQIDAFIADPAPDAYGKLVVQLLQSPHYGERWARLWLDAARYADSDGFEKDKPRFVYFYRDWVIQAFNRDLPYDQFIIEQIAGDMLPNATQDQQVATGFLRNSMINEEGGIDPEQFRMEAMFDRIDAIGKSILGLTIQCGQCHSHKFDPLTQNEYYRMFAFLNNAHESNITVYTPTEQQMRSDILRQIESIENELRARDPDWATKLRDWAESVQKNQVPWTLVRPVLDASGGQKHYVLEDGSIFAQGYAPTKHTTDFTVTTDVERITGVRLELLNDPNLPRRGPGRSVFGLFGLTEFKSNIGPADGSKAAIEAKFVRAAATANAPEKDLDPRFDDRSNRKRITGGIAFAIDGKDETAWSPDMGFGRSNVPHEAIFVFEQPQQFSGSTSLTFRLTQNHGGWNSDDNQNNNLGRFRFWVTNHETPDVSLIPTALQPILGIPAAEWSKEQQQALFSYWRTTVADWKSENDRIEILWKSHPAGSTQLVYQERTEPRDTYLLKRGDFLNPVARVDAGVPAFLHSIPDQSPRNRLTFARWLADRNSPTTARAIVNRIWQAYFGTGIVSTSEDLGTQSDPPSHPELLDWLACELMEPTIDLPGTSQTPWSIKRLHQLIVLSATYRQSSRLSDDATAQDPQNRLLSRGPRLRVDAELVRDIALSVSGLLRSDVGGPSVYPPIPGFLMLPPASYGPKVWSEDTGPARYRRAMYTFQFRSIPYPALQAFDAPNGDASCVRRTRSNTPLQALTTLNEPVFVECAQALGLRAIVEFGPTDLDRIRFAFRQVLGRLPTHEEFELLEQLLTRQRKRFAEPGADCWSIAVSRPEDFRKLPNSATPADWAAWTVVARVLLNLDETMTKE